jgi:hypothetical protein
MQNSNWNVNEDILQAAEEVDHEKMGQLKMLEVGFNSAMLAEADPETAVKLQAQYLISHFCDGVSEAPFDTMNSAVVLAIGTIFAQVLMEEDGGKEKLQAQKDNFMSMVEDFHQQMKAQKDG